MAMVGLLNAPRGTKLYQRLFREQRLTRVASGDNTDCSINFDPKMGLKDLLEGYQKVIQTIYSQKQYCERIKTFLKNYQISSSTKIHFRYREMRALLKSSWHIGVLSKGRIHYWKLMLWSLRKRHYLHLAVIFSIHGYHFRKVFRAVQQRAANLLRESEAPDTNLNSYSGPSPVFAESGDRNV